jgi:hypothetical protein
VFTSKPKRAVWAKRQKQKKAQSAQPSRQLGGQGNHERCLNMAALLARH